MASRICSAPAVAWPTASGCSRCRCRTDASWARSSWTDQERSWLYQSILKMRSDRVRILKEQRKQKFEFFAKLIRGRKVAEKGCQGIQDSYRLHLGCLWSNTAAWSRWCFLAGILDEPIWPGNAANVPVLNQKWLERDLLFQELARIRKTTSKSTDTYPLVLARWFFALAHSIVIRIVHDLNLFGKLKWL